MTCGFICIDEITVLILLICLSGYLHLCKLQTGYLYVNLHVSLLLYSYSISFSYFVGRLQSCGGWGGEPEKKSVSGQSTMNNRTRTHRG